MPFGDMGEDDLIAIISYLRAQPPVRNVVPPNEWTLMGKVVKSFVAIAKPRAAINPPQTPGGAEGARCLSRPLGRGLRRLPYAPRSEHLHRDWSRVLGRLRDGAGTVPGADPTVWFTTPNITPMTGSALMKFPDRDTFIARFQKGGRHCAGSPMPWEAFARMTTEDIGALYEYLHSLEPHDGPTGEPTFTKAD